MSFMIGVLGSVMFWVGFFVVGFFAGSLLIKHVAPHVYKFITDPNLDEDKQGCELWTQDKFGYVMIIIAIYLFWPFIIVGVIAYFATKLFFTKIAWPLFLNGFKASVSMVPDIEIKKKETV